MGPGVGFLHPQVQKQLRHTLTLHRAAPVGMNSELVWLYPLLQSRREDQLLCQLRALTLGDDPAYNIAAEDVDNHIQTVVTVLERPFEEGDVPTPDLVRSSGEQLRLFVLRMTRLGAALFTHLLCAQEAIHRRSRTQIDTFVEQRCHDLSRRPINKTLG